MAERSKRILITSKEKLEKLNKETLKLLQKYEIDMSIRELSPNTIYSYKSDLYQWLSYVLDNQFNQSVLTLTDDDITEFLYFCKKEGNNVERMRRRMASISAFYKFLRKKRLIIENPMEFLDRPKRGQSIVVQTFLTKEQVSLMREKLIEYGNLQIRIYALFSLSTMARATAVSTIRWKQINFEERVVSGVQEKEGKIVDLFFSKEVKELLLQLQEERKLNNVEDYGYVFIGHNTKPNTPIRSNTLNDWCKLIGKLIDVSTLHPHDFRHSGATLLKNAGMQLEDISALLNHEGTDTTRKYYIKQDTKQITKLKDMFEV